MSQTPRLPARPCRQRIRRTPAPAFPPLAPPVIMSPSRSHSDACTQVHDLDLPAIAAPDTRGAARLKPVCPQASSGDAGGRASEMPFPGHPPDRGRERDGLPRRSPSRILRTCPHRKRNRATSAADPGLASVKERAFGDAVVHHAAPARVTFESTRARRFTRLGRDAQALRGRAGPRGLHRHAPCRSGPKRSQPTCLIARGCSPSPGRHRTAAVDKHHDGLDCVATGNRCAVAGASPQDQDGLWAEPRAGNGRRRCDPRSALGCDVVTWSPGDVAAAVRFPCSSRPWACLS